MKKRLRALASFLCLCLCITAAMPVQAANENNTKGVTFRAALDTPTIFASNQDQTVVMRVTASEPVELAGIGGKIVWDNGLTLNAITNDDTNINFNGCVNTDNGLISFYDAELATFSDVTSIATATFTVPANTSAGTYEVGMKDIELISWDAAKKQYVAWESNAVTTAMLTIKEATPSENYTVGMSVPGSEVSVGETVKVNVNVTHNTDTVFTAGEIVIKYDSTKLTFDKDASGEALKNVTVSDKNGVLKLEDYGADKNLTDAAYTLAFKANKTGVATVTLVSAAFGDKIDSETLNLTPATISVGSVAVTISSGCYAVTLPDIFTGPETVQAGDSYTFSVKDSNNYTYGTVTAMVNGKAVEVIDNGNGTYTIESVNGALVISGSRTAKSYTVTFQGTGAEDMTGKSNTATYGTDYTFTMPTDTTGAYTYSLDSIVIGGKSYSGYTVKEAEYTIPGSAITGDIVITVSKTAAETNWFTVVVEGTGAGAASGYESTVKKGDDYTLIIAPKKGYTYTVTASMNGKNIEVIDNGDNSYTVKNVTGNIVFNIESTVVVSGVTVTEYLKLDGTVIWLVKNATTLETGSVATYDGANMFWSDKYEAYCYLVVADTLSLEDAAAKVSITTGTAAAVDYGMDVNKSGEVDANDAQLTYNMYNVCYNSFTETVTMEKFLRADVNGDGKVNTEDAVAIIAAALNGNKA